MKLNENVKVFIEIKLNFIISSGGDFNPSKSVIGLATWQYFKAEMIIRDFLIYNIFIKYLHYIFHLYKKRFVIQIE